MARVNESLITNCYGLPMPGAGVALINHSRPRRPGVAPPTTTLLRAGDGCLTADAVFPTHTIHLFRRKEEGEVWLFDESV